jgi:Zn-finger protein
MSEAKPGNPAAMACKDRRRSYWRGKAYSFFRHEECEWFPCHKTDEPESFNCLFCYCPLYALDEGCGGDFKHLPNGVKDCSACMFPHKKENYGSVVDRFNEIAAMMREARERENKPETGGGAK